MGHRRLQEQCGREDSGGKKAHKAAKLIKKERENTYAHIYRIRKNTNREISAEKMNRTTRECFDQLYANKCVNLDETDSKKM